MPQLIPTDTAVAEWSSAEVQGGLLRSFLNAGDATTIAKMGNSVTEMLNALPQKYEAADVSDAPPEDVLHDAYFHVDRVTGTPAEIIIRLALAARAVLLEEVDETPLALSLDMVHLIDSSLADFVACLCGGTVDTALVVLNWQPARNIHDPMKRWIRGHQIFAALTQGLIFSFKAMGKYIRSGTTSEIQRWADLSISLLRGSGAAFVLTGDFPVEDYISTIRPSMMPPAAPICLSGLMSSDHRILVQTIRDLRPALKYLREHEKERHGQIFQELQTVYDRHILVCERFVGERPSLLTAGSTEKSGPELIEQFKTLRLKAFESPAHTSRLKAEPIKQSEPGCPFSNNMTNPR